MLLIAKLNLKMQMPAAHTPQQAKKLDGAPWECLISPCEVLRCLITSLSGKFLSYPSPAIFSSEAPSPFY